MNLEDLDIGFLSFNLEYLNNTYSKLNNIKQNDFKNNILNDFKQNLNFKKNIWIIITQEDNNNSIFCKIIQNYLKENNFELLKYKKEGRSILGISTKFFLHLSIFIKKDIINNIKFKHTKIITHLSGIKKFLKTKNTIICNIQVLTKEHKLNNNNTYNNIFIIGSHLPVKTKEIILFGYNTRINIINNILKYLHNYIIKEPNENIGNHILWIGDLNFRLEKKNKIESDQITKYIKNTKKNINIPIKLFDLSNIKKYGPTCKINIGNIKHTKKCIKQYTGKEIPDEECYKININKNKIILPSYCDRILGWSEGKYILSSKVKPLIHTFFTQFSDHNPILGDIYFIKNNKYQTNIKKISKKI